MDLKALAGNRKVQIGAVATVAGAGAFTWYRSKSKTPAPDASATDGSGTDTPAAYSAGTFPDTSGTDIASWLTQNEAAFMTELQDYLSSQPTAGTPAPSTPSPVTVPVTHPVTGTPVHRVTGKPATNSHPSSVKAVKFEKGQSGTTPSTLSGISAWAKAHGVNVSVKQLQKLNGLGNSTIVHTGQTYKV